MSYFQPITSGRYRGWKPNKPVDFKPDLFMEQRRQEIADMKSRLNSGGTIEPEDHVEIGFALGWYKEQARIAAEVLHSCPTCERKDAFDADEEFLDETGFVCRFCGSNVYYEDVKS